jgi:hypothetical protein
MSTRPLTATAATLLLAVLVAAPAWSRTSGATTLQASGALKGRFVGSCVIPTNPTNATLHKRFVILNFSRTGESITVTVDAWQTGKINLATTKMDSIGLGTGTTSGATSGWFAGWTGTQAPLLSPHGKSQGSGTIVTSKSAQSGTLNVTLVASSGNKNKQPLHLKGSWTGC